MAKKTKDAAAAPAKKTPKPPADPVKTRNLVRLLNILALLLAITAFLLQFFAVVTHNWKRQVTNLHAVLSPDYHYARQHVYEDSRLDQRYGLYARDVKLFAHNDEALHVWSTTQFPRPDDGHGPLHECLAKTSTLRGALLTCSDRVISPESCHCRRYIYWKFLIFFEILALILLGIVVFVCALLTTQYHSILKPVGAALSFLAFLLLIIGFILLTTNLRRETRSLADAYPHIHQRLVQELAVRDHHHRAQENPTALRRAVRQAHETYHLYQLGPGQIYHNQTHFRMYSEQQRNWVYYPVSTLAQNTNYAPRTQDSRVAYAPVQQQAPVTDAPEPWYGPPLTYEHAIGKTNAWISWSAIFSILAALLALLIPALLALSLLKGKSLAPDTKTVTTTTVKTEYVPVPQEVTVETVPLQPRYIPADYDHNRPIGEAVVTTHNVPYNRNEPVIVRDVVIRDDHPVQPTYSRPQQYGHPVNVETTHRS